MWLKRPFSLVPYLCSPRKSAHGRASPPALTPSFYTRNELALRIAIMYSGNSLSNGFGSILAAAIISGMKGKGGLAGWRWLCEFIVDISAV